MWNTVGFFILPIAVERCPFWCCGIGSVEYGSYWGVESGNTAFPDRGAAAWVAMETQCRSINAFGQELEAKALHRRRRGAPLLRVGGGIITEGILLMGQSHLHI